MTKIPHALLVLLMVLPSALHGQSPDPPRPRVGLVLSGGGARGGAHIGVLEVLEQLHVPVDYVVGTSIGAVIGGLYAAGLSPEQMTTEIQKIDWVQIFDDDPERSELSFRRKEDDWSGYFPFELGISRDGLKAPAGLVSGRKLVSLFRNLTFHTSGVATFDDLPIPFRAVATDLTTGDAVVIDRGPLESAMRASMSLPGAFTPVEMDGRLLVDGGVSNNLAINVARNMGADVVIVVDVSPPLLEKDEDWTLIDVSVQTISLLMKMNTRRSVETLTDRDVLIMPDITDVGFASFRNMLAAVSPGETATREAAASLSKLAVDSQAYAAFLHQQRREMIAPDVPFAVDRVTVEQSGRVPEEVVRRRLELSDGESVSLAQLDQDLARVYQIGEFEEIDLDVQNGAGARNLTVKPSERDTGPQYLRFGMRIDAVPGHNTAFALLLYHRWAFVNRLGAEWTNRLDIGNRLAFESELYQPLTTAGFFFIAPRVAAIDYDLNVFLDNGRQDVLDNNLWFGQADGGFRVSNVMQVRGGFRLGDRRTELLSVPGSGENFNIGEWVLGLSLDHLDHTGFPTAGGEILLESRLSRSSIGADDDYDRLWARAAIAGSLGRLTINASGEAGTDLGGGIPFYDDFRLGGFTRLSGLENGERSGGAMGFGTLALYYRLGDVPELVGGGVYVGMTGEAGNAWPTQHDIDFADLIPSGSVFLGVDTAIGPLYTAYAVAEGGRNTWYIILGPVFAEGRRS